MSHRAAAGPRDRPALGSLCCGDPCAVGSAHRPQPRDYALGRRGLASIALTLRGRVTRCSIHRPSTVWTRTRTRTRVVCVQSSPRGHSRALCSTYST